jgi:glycosyltransferase involved in cell wall biosynthesis
MRILYLITGLGGGGAEKVVADLADQMVDKGHTVKIAYLKGDIIVRPKNFDIEIIYLALESASDFKKAYKNYKKVLNEFQPDLVHAHMVHANIFARLSRKFHPVPKLICTAHSNNEGGKLRMFAYRFTHNLANLTTNVSNAASHNFEKLGAVPKNAIVTIYNGINLNKFIFNIDVRNEVRAKLNVKSHEKMILAVGRLHEAKDYPNLLNAIIHLKQKYQSFHLFIAGTGELRPFLNELIEKYQISQNVTLLGRRDDIPDLLSAADVFVLPSKFEGFGLVVAEAMACECFVVATDCGGVKEVMDNYGILVPPENPEALSDGLLSALLLNEEELKANNVKALDYVRNAFALEKIVDQWLKVYEQK